tara:strand:- start:58 stop:948 length:891 start_codon:yes stop_codon:yes gene_type:complete
MVEHANPMTMIDQNAIEAALMDGDLSRLSAEEKLSHYQMVCKTVGLNPLTKPFQYITLNGKLQMYALKGATDQLRKIYKIDCEVVNTETINGLYIVRVKVKDKYGRVDEDMGFAKIENLNGDALGNAMLKAVTKAKRRATLSMCGLGMLDEDEVKSIPAQSVRQETDLNEQIEKQLKVVKPVSEVPPEVEEKIQEKTEEHRTQEGYKVDILIELERLLGFDITHMIVNDATKEEIQEKAKKNLKGFTSMCDFYVENKDTWKKEFESEPELFDEIHGFCVQIKEYFEPWIGEPNEEE